MIKLDKIINLVSLLRIALGRFCRADANLPQENMKEIMNIIRGTDINNLTTEEKEKLKALGVDDSMLNRFKNMIKEEHHLKTRWQ